MYDSKSDRTTARPEHKRENLFIGYSVTNPTYRMVHQAPAMTIEDGLRDYQDDLEDVNVANDGLVIDCESIDWDLTKPPSAPYRSESTRYDVRIAALIDTGQPAKAAKRIVDVEHSYTERKIDVLRHYGSLVQASTRRFRR